MKLDKNNIPSDVESIDQWLFDNLMIEVDDDELLLACRDGGIKENHYMRILFGKLSYVLHKSGVEVSSHINCRDTHLYINGKIIHSGNDLVEFLPSVEW